MFGKLMNSKAGIAIRMAGILAFLALSHFIARVLSVFLSDGYESHEICYSDGYCYEQGVAVDYKWYDNAANGWFSHILYNVFGLLLIVAVFCVTVLVIAGTWWIIRRTVYFVMGWKWETYVDPCQDPDCSCERHVVERREAEDRRRLAAAAVVGGIAGGVLGNS